MSVILLLIKMPRTPHNIIVNRIQSSSRLTLQITLARGHRGQREGHGEYILNPKKIGSLIHK